MSYIIAYHGVVDYSNPNVFKLPLIAYLTGNYNIEIIRVELNINAEIYLNEQYAGQLHNGILSSIVTKHDLDNCRDMNIYFISRNTISSKINIVLEFTCYRYNVTKIGE